MIGSSSSEFLPWTATRLRKLASDLSEAAGLADVGDIGRGQLNAARAYIEALADTSTRRAVVTSRDYGREYKKKAKAARP